MTAFHGFSAAIIIMACSLAMLVIYKNRKLHNIQGILRFNLAFSDCLSSFGFVGAAVAPYFYVYSPVEFKNPDFESKQSAQRFFNGSVNDKNFEFFVQNKLKYNPDYDNQALVLFGIICYSAGFSSMYTYLVASIDRFIAIKYPFKYRRKASKSKAYKICVLIWLVAITVNLTLTLKRKIKFYFFKSMFIFYNGEYELIVDLVYLFVPLLVCWVLNLTTLYSIRKSKQKMLKVARKRAQRRMARIDTRVSAAAKTISIMVFTYTISFLPFTVNIFVYNLNSYRYLNYKGFKIEDKDNYDTSFDFIYIFFVIVLYNNFWNFLIYQLRDLEFRNYFKYLFFQT